MGELDVIEHFEVVHDAELGEHAEAAWGSGSNLKFLAIVSQVTMGDPHALLHRYLVKVLVVVSLGHIFRLSFAFVVQERSVVIWDPLIVFHVAKDVEQLFIIGFGVLQLFWQVVFKITIGSALSRLVSLVALGPHGHHILDPPLDHGLVDIVHA